MKGKKGLFYAICATLVVSVLSLLIMWFLPFWDKEPQTPQVLIFSSKAYTKNVIIPVIKDLNKPLKSSENEEQLLEFLNSPVENKALIIDGNLTPKIIYAVNNYNDQLDIILLNPLPFPSSNLNPNEMTNLLILGEAGGALKSDKTAISVFNSISKSSIEPNSRPVHTKKGNIYLNIYPAPIVSVGTLPKEALQSIFSFLSKENNDAPHFSVQLPNIKLLMSILAIISLFSVEIILAVKYSYTHEFAEGIVAAEIKSNSLFYLSRGLLILVSLIPSFFVFLILGIFDSLHRGGILFLSYFIGCSTTTMLFYRYGMLGIKGKPLDIKPPFTIKNILLSLLIVITVVITGFSLASGGFWSLGMGDILTHIMTALVFILLSLGFISVMQDYILLKKAVNKEETALMLLLFPYIPLFAIAAIYIPMGEIYLTISVLKLILFSVICIISSKIIKDITGSALISAMSGAFCLSFFTCYQLYI